MPKKQVLRFLPFYPLILAFQASSCTPKRRTFRDLSIGIGNSSFHAFWLDIENWKSTDITKIDENRRKSAKISENRRKSTKINENQRKSTKINENRRKSTKTNENRRKSTKICENQRKSTKINENLRKSSKITENLRVFVSIFVIVQPPFV